jgi:hypothetical protein
MCAEYKRPDGCVCQDGEWECQPGPVCSEYTPFRYGHHPDWCKTCEHGPECHGVKGGFEQT